MSNINDSNEDHTDEIIADTNDIKKQWIKLELLGAGTYGDVFKTKNKHTGAITAIKHIRLDENLQNGIDPNTLREVIILGTLEHKNVVKLVDVIQKKGFYLVFEYLRNNLNEITLALRYMHNINSFYFLEPFVQKLFEEIRVRKNSFKENDHSSDKVFVVKRATKIYYDLSTQCYNHLIQYIFREILIAVKYIHMKKVLHRDLKPSNFLIDYKEENVLETMRKWFLICIESYKTKVTQAFNEKNNSCYNSNSEEELEIEIDDDFLNYNSQNNETHLKYYLLETKQGTEPMSFDRLVFEMKSILLLHKLFLQVMNELYDNRYLADKKRDYKNDNTKNTHYDTLFNNSNSESKLSSGHKKRKEEKMNSLKNFYRNYDNSNDINTNDALNDLNNLDLNSLKDTSDDLFKTNTNVFNLNNINNNNNLGYSNINNKIHTDCIDSSINANINRQYNDMNEFSLNSNKDNNNNKKYNKGEGNYSNINNNVTTYTSTIKTIHIPNSINPFNNNINNNNINNTNKTNNPNNQNNTNNNINKNNLSPYVQKQLIKEDLIKREIENLLNIKVADFGLARLVKTTNLQYTQNLVTLWYRPPEILENARIYDEKVDMWSVGCIFAELLIGEPLIRETGDLMQLVRIKQFLPDTSNSFSVNLTNIFNHKQQPVKASLISNRIRDSNRIIDDSAIELIEKLLVYKSENRLYARNALKHFFFEKRFI